MNYEVYGPYLPLIMLITFIGLFIWVASPKNKERFEDASQLPFADDDANIKVKQREPSNGRVE